ncbi:C2 family cysteine protease [Altericista sp. CCNU0014]|uniref:C2 family cysteine protease n=1 Tax=Altericista sp. CCNU0014 TaxID=3082949 RepID=UPI00384C0CFB
MVMRSHANNNSTKGSGATTVQASLKSRPFAPPAKSDPSQTMANLQAQLEHGQCYGHCLAKISLSPSPSAPQWIQPKLTIGALGGQYEQGADRVAQRVVQQLHVSQRTVQPRLLSANNASERYIQRKPQKVNENDWQDPDIPSQPKLKLIEETSEKGQHFEIVDTHKKFWYDPKNNHYTTESGEVLQNLSELFMPPEFEKLRSLEKIQLEELKKEEYNKTILSLVEKADLPTLKALNQGSFLKNLQTILSQAEMMFVRILACDQIGLINTFLILASNETKALLKKSDVFSLRIQKMVEQASQEDIINWRVNATIIRFKDVLPIEVYNNAYKKINFSFPEVEVREEPKLWVSSGTAEKGTGLYQNVKGKREEVGRLSEPTSIQIIKKITSQSTTWNDFYEIKIKDKEEYFYIHKSRLSFDEYKYQNTPEPLFPTEPSINHVRQGHIGNCYLLAAVISILEKGSSYIVSMMQDNEDTTNIDPGSVTVRFYRKKSEKSAVSNNYLPEYIRIKKSVPKTSKGKDAYSQEYFWVQMLEKAYAAFTGAGDSSSYEKTVGGNAALAMTSAAFEALLGPAAKIEKIKMGVSLLMSFPWSDKEKESYTAAQQSKDYNSLVSYKIFGGQEQDQLAKTKVDKWMKFVCSGKLQEMLDLHQNGKYKKETKLEHFESLFEKHSLDRSVTNDMMKWLKESEVYPGKRGTGKYSKSQIEMFNVIKNALDNKRYVTLGSKEVVGRLPSGSGHSSGEGMSKGLVGQHAYSVVGYEEFVSNPETSQKGDLHWVCLRNPWGYYGRKYKPHEKGLKAKETKAPLGRFWLELSDLTKRFSHIYKA